MNTDSLLVAYQLTDNLLLKSKIIMAQDKVKDNIKKKEQLDE